jgi:glutathione S-transferase
LLTSALHHHLIREKKRTQVGLIVECGDAREVHHMALLIGYGAGAINPYLAFESIEDMIAANDGPFKQALDRYKYPHRYGLADSLEHREAARDHLSGLNDILATQPYLGGNAPAFTDIALFPFVRQFAATDQLWFDALLQSALQAWLNGLLASDLFGQIMTRYHKWTADADTILFP